MLCSIVTKDRTAQRMALETRLSMNMNTRAPSAGAGDVLATSSSLSAFDDPDFGNPIAPLSSTVTPDALLSTLITSSALEFLIQAFKYYTGDKPKKQLTGSGLANGSAIRFLKSLSVKVLQVAFSRAARSSVGGNTYDPLFSVEEALFPVIQSTETSRLGRALQGAFYATTCSFFYVASVAAVELCEWHSRDLLLKKESEGSNASDEGPSTEKKKKKKTKKGENPLGPRKEFYSSTFGYMGKTFAAIFCLSFVGGVVYPTQGIGCTMGMATGSFIMYLV